MSPLDLQGQVALVTGASRGIGSATARALAAHGASVVLVGRERSSLEAVADGLPEASSPHLPMVCDVKDAAQIRDVMKAVFSATKRLDILVNNAGILDDALVGMVTAESVEQTFRVNTFAAIEFLQAGARLMRRRGSGSIINMTSIVGINGNAGQIAYSSSKSALLGLTKSAAKELAPAGIRVNAVAPGFIDTDMARQLPEAKFDERVGSIAMQRIGSAEDVAHAVLFLASGLSSYVTGQVVGVDGGMLI